VLVFNTVAINSKTTRNSIGVQVMKEKKGSRMTSIKFPQDSGIKELDYYRTQNIPAVGCYLKDEDLAIDQITLV